LHRELWWRNLRAREYFEDVGVDGRIILNEDVT
jgi:hypothetical protein